LVPKYYYSSEYWNHLQIMLFVLPFTYIIHIWNTIEIALNRGKFVYVLLALGSNQIAGLDSLIWSTHRFHTGSKPSLSRVETEWWHGPQSDLWFVGERISCVIWFGSLLIANALLWLEKSLSWSDACFAKFSLFRKWLRQAILSDKIGHSLNIFQSDFITFRKEHTRSFYLTFATDHSADCRHSCGIPNRHCLEMVYSLNGEAMTRKTSESNST
jgi:hypothetical protein